MSNTFKAEVDKLDKQLNDAIYLRSSTIDKLHKQDADFRQTLNDLRRDTENTRDQIHSADHEILRLREELSRINSSMVPKKHNFNEIERKQNTEDDDHAKLAEEAKSLNTKVENEKKANAALKKEAENLTKEIDSIEAKLKDNHDDTHKTHDSIAQSQAETHNSLAQQRDIDYKLGNINKNVLYHEDSKNEVDDIHDKWDKHVNALNMTLDKLLKRRKEIEQDNANEAAKVKSLEDKISKTSSEIHDLNHKLDELDAKRNKLHNDVHSEESRKNHISLHLDDAKSRTHYSTLIIKD